MMVELETALGYCTFDVGPSKPPLACCFDKWTMNEYGKLAQVLSHGQHDHFQPFLDMCCSRNMTQVT